VFNRVRKLNKMGSVGSSGKTARPHRASWRAVARFRLFGARASERRSLRAALFPRRPANAYPAMLKAKCLVAIRRTSSFISAATMATFRLDWHVTAHTSADVDSHFLGRSNLAAIPNFRSPA
jgi:hypothetical protein